MPISLPPDASPEHLRKQAKQLLKSCRRHQPEAARRFTASHPSYQSGRTDPTAVRLQEAQLVIAREYGFGSWATLLQAIATGTDATGEDDASGILLMTNGTHTVRRMEEAGIPGVKEEWLEILHESPVPLTDDRAGLNRIRARHFEAIGWTSFEGAMSGFSRRERPLADPSKYRQLQLWFEHDLYDQLQLIQLLDFLSDQPEWRNKAKLVQFNQFLGRIPLSELTEGQSALRPVTAAQIQLAKQAWEAYRQPTPESLTGLLKRDSSALPCLRAAVYRICQEFPDVASGLGRTERQILTVLDHRECSPNELFRDCQAAEEAPFMGDGGFFLIVERLTRGTQSLITLPDSAQIRLPSRSRDSEAFHRQRLQLSEAGKRTLAGAADRLRDLPDPYWIGGCRISGPEAPRWNQSTESLEYQ